MYELNIIDKDINIDIKDTDKYIKYIEKLTNIHWRIIPNYENYIISEYGNVINIRSKKILKPILSRYNYYTINLYNKNNIFKIFRIHRLVYKIFIDQDIEDYSIHHKDGNKLNNHYSNLEKMDFSKHSKYHHNLEFEKNIEKYKKYYKDKIKYNLSNSKLAKLYNISESAISQGIKRYITYIRLNKNKNKYNNLSKEEKKDFFKEISIEEKKDKAKQYLKECKKIYNLRYKDHISTKKISKKYNIPKSTVEFRINNYKIYLYLNKDFDKYISLSDKDKNKLYSKIYNNKLLKDQRKYLNECEKIYNLRYKDYLSMREISKKHNIPKYIIERMIKRYKIYLYLNKDFNKYISLSDKDKNKLYSKMLVENKEKYLKEYKKIHKNILINNQRRYLEKCKKIYDLKYRKNLFVKEIAKKYNIPKYTIERMIKRYKIYLYLDKDFNKYISLSKKDKDKLYSNTILVNDQRKYLEKCEKVYYLKYLNNLPTEKIANQLNLSLSTIEKMIKRYKIYLYLDKDFNKYISLSKKDKDKLYSKILVERRDNVILDIGKMIKDLKLSGLSNKDIANKLNISIGKITYYYKRYKDLIRKI